MKKEILVAILIGLFIGLVIAGVFFLTKTNTISSPTAMYSPLIEDYLMINNSKIKFANDQSHQIAIINPPDQSVTTQGQTDLTGQTTPDSVVTIIFENGEKSVRADSQGAFDTKVSLVNGENEITLMSFSPSGSVTSKTITVVLSSFEY